jgi:hypothetical protein
MKVIVSKENKVFWICLITVIAKRKGDELFLFNNKKGHKNLGGFYTLIISKGLNSYWTLRKLEIADDTS